MINTPLTNIMNRSSVEEYISETYQRKNPAETLCARVAADIPQGTKVKLALRSADTIEALQKAPFMDVELNKTVPAEKWSGKYLQYSLQLIAPDGINTPRVRQVDIVFN